MTVRVTTLGLTVLSMATCAALVAAAACGSSDFARTAPQLGDYELPPPDASLDPARLRVGQPLFACGRWATPRPADERLLVDVFFARRSAADPDDRPRPESLQDVADRGGEILFVFPFPAARVWIATDSIPGLLANYVATVPDPTRYDWPVSVGLSHPLTAADSARFAELGGRVRYLWPLMPALAGDLPSRSVSKLRATSGVTYVEASGLGCVA
jgi:hypothetical protein